LASPEPQVQARIKSQAKKPVRENLNKTHHYEAWQVGEKWVSWRLVRNKDNLVRHAHHPYGKEILRQAGLKKIYSVTKFHAILKARMKHLGFKRAKPVKKANTVTEARMSPRATSTTSYDGALALGYNPSTGYVPSSNCYIATTQLNNLTAQYNFSSTGASSSFAAQTDVSASISTDFSTAIASGSTNDVFTYGNSYSQTGTSGSVFYTAYALYTANNNFISLNDAGKNAQSLGQLASICGSNFVTSVPVGMLITGQASYYASTSAGSTSISNSFSANASGSVGSLGNLTAAVSNVYSNTSLTSTNTFSFGFTTETLGGGEGAAAVYTADLTSLATPWCYVPV
jgi:hypothetical protein